MEGVVLGISIIGTFSILLFNQYKIRKALNQESNLLKENLNHVAGAIVGLSELLEEADQVIEEASRIPTAGEMIQQMIMSFISQKMQPVLSPLDSVQNTISHVGPQAETWPEERQNEKAQEEQNIKEL